MNIQSDFFVLYSATIKTVFRFLFNESLGRNFVFNRQDKVMRKVEIEVN